MFRPLFALILFLEVVGIGYLVAGEPIVLSSSNVAAPKQPQAAISADGIVHVVFGVGEDVVHCRSMDEGKSFGEPTVAFRVPNLSLGMRRGPRIAVVGETLVVSAIGGKLGKGKDGDLVAWRSIDGGQTWLGPVQVNDSNNSAREGLHAMAASSSGEAWCTWLDLRNQRTEIFASKSTDGGANWSPNQLVYRSPEKSVCECCHPSIAIHDGLVHVLFRNSLAGNRDMFLASFRGQDGSSSGSKRLGNESWKLDACPMDGGMLSINPTGLVSTIWRRGRSIIVANADGSDEQLLGIGEQPTIASTSEGPIAVWSVRRDGELMLQKLSGGEPQSIAKVARDAVIVSDPKRKNSTIVLWEKSENGQSSILASRVDLTR